MWNCTHFRHPTDEQLGHVDIFFSNYYNLQSVYFELNDAEETKSTFRQCLYYLLHTSLNNNHYIYDKMKEGYLFHTMFPVPYHGLLHLDCIQLQLHLHPFEKLANR